MKKEDVKYSMRNNYLEKSENPEFKDAELYKICQEFGAKFKETK